MGNFRWVEVPADVAFVNLDDNDAPLVDADGNQRRITFFDFLEHRLLKHPGWLSMEGSAGKMAEIRRSVRKAKKATQSVAVGSELPMEAKYLEWQAETRDAAVELMKRPALMALAIGPNGQPQEVVLPGFGFNPLEFEQLESFFGAIEDAKPTPPKAKLKVV